MRKIKLTKEEALSEYDLLIEENIKMLTALRQRAERGRKCDTSLEVAKSHTDLLHNVLYYGAYISGAMAMLRRLRDSNLTLEEHILGGKDKLKVTPELKVYNKATLDLILGNKLNAERFLEGAYLVAFADHVRDRKGKLQGCRAFFAKKVEKYIEV